jgi:hypothetical protein
LDEKSETAQAIGRTETPAANSGKDSGKESENPTEYLRPSPHGMAVLAQYDKVNLQDVHLRVRAAQERISPADRRFISDYIGLVSIGSKRVRIAIAIGQSPADERNCVAVLTEPPKVFSIARKIWTSRSFP